MYEEVERPKVLKANMRCFIIFIYIGFTYLFSLHLILSARDMSIEGASAKDKLKFSRAWPGAASGLLMVV